MVKHPCHYMTQPNNEPQAITAAEKETSRRARQLTQIGSICPRSFSCQAELVIFPSMCDERAMHEIHGVQSAQSKEEKATHRVQ